MQISKHFIYKLNQYLGYPSLVEERDACGVGFLAHLNQPSSHYIVSQALGALKCMEHRGACGADGISGDGSGITTQIPWSLLLKDLNINISHSNYKLGLAMVFLPQEGFEKIKEIFNWVLSQNGLDLLGWREVPVNTNVLGKYAFKNKPNVQQCIVGSSIFSNNSFERQLYIVRKKIEKHVAQIDLSKQFYVCSFSSRIVIYKGMVRSEVLGIFYL